MESSAAGGGVAMKRVKWIGTTRRHDESPGGKVLHRKTEGIKFNRTRIAPSKIAYGYEVINNQE